jgi:hypothetical protein
MSFLCWFIILKFVFHVLPLTLNFIYKYILATNWFCIIYIKHSCPLSHKHEQLLLKAHFQNPQFQGQKHLWTKCAQIDYKKKIHLFKSSMLKSSLSFKRNVAHMVKKTRTIHFRSLSALNMQNNIWFMSNFEHVNFAINEKIPKVHYDNWNYNVSLVIFQTYKNVILGNVHSLGWFILLSFYPNVMSTILKIFILKVHQGIQAYTPRIFLNYISKCGIDNSWFFCE